ncbi:hypothetical protein CHLRE_14g609250v5 [Chlamydomonas reinhardtii]|uniref:Uncharacterized protein n=1 Tax=Chlamydomonas reinhardtii TaxID=3055 RepID=A0A2K3CX66_CHLRE|nr:uncharacterized protein CHLRE_14g609250v5 [Chlamydomonas reinhardtii]PNW72860.1 hypothetical protein CHLRE_14g609250v5 [Chlamydomonas reinhardtii]
MSRGVTVVSAVRSSNSEAITAADDTTSTASGRWLEIDLDGWAKFGGDPAATSAVAPSAVAAALAPGRAAAALSAAGLQSSWRWLFMLPVDSLANLDALRVLLDGWDHTLPAAVSDCLVPTPSAADGSSSSDNGSGGGDGSSSSSGGNTGGGSSSAGKGAGEGAGAGEGGGARCCCRAGGRACRGRRTPPAVLSAAGGVALSRGLLYPCPANAISSSSSGNGSGGSSSSSSGGSSSSSRVGSRSNGGHRSAAQLLWGGGAANAAAGGVTSGSNVSLTPPALAALAHFLAASEPLSDGSGFDVLSRLLYYSGLAITTPHPHPHAASSSSGGGGGGGGGGGLVLGRHRFGGHSATYTFRGLDQAAALCGGATAAATTATATAATATAVAATAAAAPPWCSHVLWGVVSTPVAAGPPAGAPGGAAASAAATAAAAATADTGTAPRAQLLLPPHMYESLWAALNATSAAATAFTSTGSSSDGATGSSSDGAGTALQPSSSASSSSSQAAGRRYYSGLVCQSPLPSCLALPGACVGGGAGPEPPCAVWRRGRFDWGAPEPHYEWENFLDWRGSHNPHHFGWRVPLAGYHRPGTAPPDLPACKEMDVPGFWGRGRWIAHVPHPHPQPGQQQDPAAAAAAAAAGAAAGAAAAGAAAAVRLTAADVASERLRPDAENSTCGFHRLSRAGLMRCFAGKRVYFVGDSLARQMYSRLVSHLRGIEASVEHAEAQGQQQGRRVLRGRVETDRRQQQQQAAAAGGTAVAAGAVAGGDGEGELLRLGFFWLESVARWQEVLPQLAPDVFVFGGMRWHDDPRGPDAALAAATAVVSHAAALPASTTSSSTGGSSTSSSSSGRPRLVVWAPFGYGTKPDNVTAAWAARLRRWAADMAAAHPPPPPGGGSGGVRVQVLPADAMSRTAPFLRDYGEEKATHWGCEYQLAWPGAIASAKTPADGDCTDLFDFNSVQMVASTYCSS